MEKIKNHLSSYLKSKELHNLGVRPTIEKGDYFYDQINEELHFCIGRNALEIDSLNLNSTEKITIESERCVKAYLASEVGEMFPIDMMLPSKFEEGWAMTDENGEIHLVESDLFYSSEIEARIHFIIYFLIIGVIKPEDIKT